MPKKILATFTTIFPIWFLAACGNTEFKSPYSGKPGLIWNPNNSTITNVNSSNNAGASGSTSASGGTTSSLMCGGVSLVGLTTLQQTSSTVSFPYQLGADSFSIFGGYALHSSLIFDLQNGAAPKLTTNPAPGSFRDYVLYGNYLIGSNNYDGVASYSFFNGVTGTTALSTATWPKAQSWRITQSGNSIFAASGNGQGGTTQLAIVDITNPSQLYVKGKYDAGSSLDRALSARYADNKIFLEVCGAAPVTPYTMDAQYFVKVLDGSNLTNPTPIKIIQPTSPVQYGSSNCMRSESKMALNEAQHVLFAPLDNTLAIIDTRSALVTTLVSDSGCSSFRGISLSPSGKYLASDSGLLFDVQNPAHPVLIATFPAGDRVDFTKDGAYLSVLSMGTGSQLGTLKLYSLGQWAI